MDSIYADYFTYDNQPIELVKEFVYLGVKLTQTLAPDAHLEHALRRAKNSAFALNSKVDLRKISYSSARKLYDAVVLPSGKYGIEVFHNYAKLDQFFVRIEGVFWKLWCGLDRRTSTLPLLTAVHTSEELMRSYPKNRRQIALNLLRNQ